jgi:hypothetical protein
MAGKTLVPLKTNQNLCWSTPTEQNRSATECWSVRSTYGKLVLSRSTTDFRLVLGPAFGSQTILENHGRPLAPEIMNIFNGRPWYDHAALCCKESLNKNFDKKINPKKIFFGEIFLKIWLRFEKFSLKNNPK